ncbi:EcsC family protein [Crenalkalicoccus roseus]|uniref:EcsC family protein n=1 Tax=Crenalkalicoccus roseus TaxID=1485588 RepID=UPI0010814E50|nr:EcsC family protein [Crenalkalicoccus roseus]
MTDTPLPTPAGLPPGARDELARAVAVLEGSSLPIRLAAMVGSSVEALKRSLPGPVQRGLDEAVRRALEAALRAAMRSRPDRPFGRLPQQWAHRGLIAASGVAGGAFGVAGTLVELPVSTALLLRQIGAVAAEHGEDLSDPAVQAECLKVFALGGRDPADDAAESGYFALRLALADALQAAVGRGFGMMLPGFLSAVAARFGVPVAVKVSAQMAPLVGAATGAAVNLAFLEHFRAVAEAHFTVRRLERAYGAAPVREAYDAMRDARMA